MESLTGRLFKMVDLLQGTPRLTTKELAQQLGVSERTVSRDVGRLRDLELPIEVTSGRQGGVSLAPGALLPCALPMTKPWRWATDYFSLAALEVWRWGGRLRARRSDWVPFLAVGYGSGSRLLAPH